MAGLEKLKDAVDRTDGQQQQPQRRTLPDLIESLTPQMQAAIPKAANLTPERMTRIALTLLRTNPKLASCTPASLLGALMTSAQLGLEPGVMQHVYLIPRWNNKLGGLECSFQMGYKGMIELARRGGVNVKARTVYTGDVFKLVHGYHDEILHEPALDDDARGEVRGYYMVATWKDGEFALWMTKNDVEKIRMRSESGKKDEGPWKTDYDAMALKSVVRQAFNRGHVPMTVDMALALNADDAVRTNTDTAVLEIPRTDYDDTPAAIEPPAQAPPIETPAADVEVIEGEVVDGDVADASTVPPSDGPLLPPEGAVTIDWLADRTFPELRALAAQYGVSAPRTKAHVALQALADKIDERPL